MQFPRLLCSREWSGDSVAARETEVTCPKRPFQSDRWHASLPCGAEAHRCGVHLVTESPRDGGTRGPCPDCPPPPPQASDNPLCGCQPPWFQPVHHLNVRSCPSNPPPLPEGSPEADGPSPWKPLPPRPGPPPPHLSEKILGQATQVTMFLLLLGAWKGGLPLLTKINVLFICLFYIYFLGETSFPRHPCDTQTCRLLLDCD